MTARLLLAGQLALLTEIQWSLVTGDPYDGAPTNLPVTVIPLRRELAPSDLMGFVRLVKFFRRNRFDFVQTHTPKASLLGLPAARLAGIPTIYTIHGSLYFRDNDPLRNIAGWLFERWCCTWANHVVSQSEEDERVLPRARICSRRKLSYVGNGIDLARFLEPVTPAVSGPKPIVLMVSRLVREKGSRDFIELARRLQQDAEFVFVGPFDNDQRDRLTPAEVEAIQDAGVVRFIGPVADVRPYLAAATVVVLPSYREGIPRAAMEAAAAGRPVVAYDVRGVREVILPSTGLLAPRGDVNALTTVVRHLLSNPERCSELGYQCRERVTEHFSEEHVVARLRDVYRRVVALSNRDNERPRRRRLLHDRPGRQL
jgi:glycosyltransferase involved in cell wall biosynthesis